MLTRRLFLRNVPPVLAVGTTIAAPVAAEAATVSPHERVVAAIAELKAALKVYDPTIADWHEKLAKAPARGQECRFMLAAFNWNDEVRS